MKTFSKYAILASASLLAIACTKNEKPSNGSENGMQVRFDMTVNGVPTSKTITEDGSNGTRTVAWRNGDAAGILVNGTAPAHQYLYDQAGDGIWKEASAADAIFANPDENYDFNAWYPYNSDVAVLSGTFLNVSVLSNQNFLYEDGNSGYDLSDVLLAKKTNVNGKDASVVELQFSHAFAMVEVLVSGSDVTAAPKEVRLRNIKRSATVDLVSGSVALADVAAESVKMCALAPAEDADSWLYRAIVPAQTVASGDMLLEVDLASEKTYVFKSPGVEFSAAKYRRIEATIGQGKASLTFPAGSIDSWEPSDVLPPVEGDEKQVDLVSIKIADLTADSFRQIGNAATYIHNSDRTEWLTETCWLMSTYVSGTTYESITGELVTDGSEKYLRMYSESGLSFGWYKSGIRYHHVAAFNAGYYKLRVTARKAADASATKLAVFIRTDKTTAHPAGDGLFFTKPTEDASSGRSEIIVTDEWATYELYFNFNKAAYSANSTVSNSATPVEVITGDAEAYDYFDLALLPNAGGKQDFHFRDVELLKITEDEYNAQK